MNLVLVTNRKAQCNRVYDTSIMEKLSSLGNIYGCFSKKDFDKNIDILQKADYIFSTWGMPILSKEEIKYYFPNVKCLFYSAGTVQYFAKPFLESGIRVFSSASANAVPVSEYTFAQIVLANKGFYQASKFYRIFIPYSVYAGQSSIGNFKKKIGLVGLGAIGSMVAEKLKTLDVEVFAYDPFMTQENADKLGVKLVDIKRLFSECDVISNHLANKKELNNFYNRDLFKLMKKKSTFINTGRGKQINEYHLFSSLIFHPTKTAVLDVQKYEYFPFISPLFYCPNIILTPHIAGSTGGEVVRMAEFMLEEFLRYLNKENLKYEVTLTSLSKMA